MTTEPRQEAGLCDLCGTLVEDIDAVCDACGSEALSALREDETWDDTG